MSDCATYYVRFRGNTPILVAAFCQSLHNIGFVAHKTKEAHDLSPACTYSPQHVALVRILEDQYQLINAVNFVLDVLDKRSKRVGDVVNDCV